MGKDHEEQSISLQEKTVEALTSVHKGIIELATKFERRFAIAQSSANPGFIVQPNRQNTLSLPDGAGGLLVSCANPSSQTLQGISVLCSDITFTFNGGTGPVFVPLTGVTNSVTVNNATSQEVALTIQVLGLDQALLYSSFLKNNQSVSLADAKGNPIGSSDTAGASLLTQLTGNLAPLTGPAPTLLATIPYSSFPASTVVKFAYAKSLSRNARKRTLMVARSTNTGLTNVGYVMGDSTIPIYDSYYGMYGIIDDANAAYKWTSIISSGQGVAASSSEDSISPNGVALSVDGFAIEISVGSTAPTSGDVYVYKQEVL